MLSWIFMNILKTKLVRSARQWIAKKVIKKLSRPPLLAIYKSFIRPHLNYSDNIYDKAYNTSFHQNLGKIQYNSAITRNIKGTSKEKLYQKLGLESFEKRR